MVDYFRGIERETERERDLKRAPQISRVAVAMSRIGYQGHDPGLSC